MTEDKSDLFDDEVTTGATLDSGTTIGGNKVFHLGNDGQGSGLDVETVDGKDVAVPGDTFTLSPSTIPAGNVQSQFASPSASPQGVGLDSSDCLWHADLTADSIYELNQTGTVQSGFASPSVSPTGVGLDSSDCLWNADLSANSIYEITSGKTLFTLGTKQ